MLEKLLDRGWIRCPDCGSEDVGWDPDAKEWTARFECKSCGNAVSEMIHHG